MSSPPGTPNGGLENAKPATANGAAAKSKPPPPKRSKIEKKVRHWWQKPWVTFAQGWIAPSLSIAALIVSILSYQNATLSYQEAKAQELAKTQFDGVVENGALRFFQVTGDPLRILAASISVSVLDPNTARELKYGPFDIYLPTYPDPERPEAISYVIPDAAILLCRKGRGANCELIMPLGFEISYVVFDDKRKKNVVWGG